MKNNELTEVKAAMPSLEGLPQKVIEYVHGLVAENAALKASIIGIESITDKYAVKGMSSIRDFIDSSHDTPNTDAAIADIESVGAEKMFYLVEPAVRNFSNPVVTSLIIKNLESLAANLRNGVKS